MSLPKWVITPDSQTAIDIADYVKVLDSLSIALEALEKAEKYIDDHETKLGAYGECPGTNSYFIEEALRRIEEIGK